MDVNKITDIVRYDISLSKEEMKKLVNIVSAYTATHVDEEASIIDAEFKQLLLPDELRDPKKITEEDNKSDIFFYDTFNMRVEEAEGNIPTNPAFTKAENFRFVWGKNKQLGIEYWDSWGENIPYSEHMWLNEYCCRLIVGFLTSKGKGISMKGDIVIFSKKTPNGYMVDNYFDNKGIISHNKTLVLKYDKRNFKLSMTKDGINMVFNNYQTTKLKEFLQYHLDLL